MPAEAVIKCERCGMRNHHETADHFKPENHEYLEHRTYTGPGCCECGKPKEGHMVKS